MSWDSSLPLLIVSSSLIPGILIFFLREDSFCTRTVLNLLGAALKVVLVVVMIVRVADGQEIETRLPLLPNIDLVLHADALSLLFVALSTVLWLVTTIYAIGYLEDSPNRSRFFGFFSLCVSATTGIALAGNLVTFLIFYEALTLVTYPLVVHRGTEESHRAGRLYLAYTLGGGALFLVGVVWLKSMAGALDFTAAGVLASRTDLSPDSLRWVFLLLITGLGVKAALVPLHGWLPVAMTAPAPVSALLHAVAVVKAGAFGIVRVVYDVYGFEFARSLGLTDFLAIAASMTILYGSIRALSQDGLKPRLAYSTVSQVSYIALGTAIAGPLATIGGIVHLVHQGVMKITLFFCVGNFAETLEVHKISEMNGIARRMPKTMIAFTVAALGMIGVPPVAGFISKWYLGVGAVDAGEHWVLFVLMASGALNAAYFLPTLYRAWFLEPQRPWRENLPATKYETRLSLLAPPLITAFLSLALGLFANMEGSALEWSRLIAAREYP